MIDPTLSDADLLKTVLAGLLNPRQLNDHPWTRRACVGQYLSQHSEHRHEPPGEILGWALSDLWRERFRPATAAPQFKREWNRYFSLEVGWFYPFRQGARQPISLPQIGALLADRQHLALVLADGDEAQATEWLQAEHQDFWEALAPSNAKDTLVLAAPGVAARRDVAVQALVKALREIETPLPETVPTAALEPPEPINRVVVKPSPLTTIDLDLALENSLPAAPVFVPTEWIRFIETARSAERLFIRGEAGSGKTCLLAAVAHDLKQAGRVPLVVRVSEYAPQAANLDLLRFAATCGAFGQIYRDEATRLALEEELAEAQRADRLVVLADQSDDVLESERRQVSQRLTGFRHLIVAERTPWLLIDRTTAISMNLPALASESIVTMLTDSGVLRESADAVNTVWHQAQARLNPALARLASPAAAEVRPGHPVKVFSCWLDQLLHQTRSTGRISSEADKARRLLRYLAAIRFDFVPHPDHTTELTRENVRRAFWQLPLPIVAEDQGWALIDFCSRAGLLIAVENCWQFMTAEIERTLAAEYAAGVSLRPRQRLLLHWTAALIAEGGDEHRAENFFQQLRAALSQTAPLSNLDAALALREFNVESSAPAQAFMAFVLDRIEPLRRIESARVRQRIEFVIQCLRHGVEPVSEECTATMIIQLDQLEHDVQNLARLLGFFKGPLPEGDETCWLEDRQVLSVLITGLRDAQLPEIKRQCAAWLRRSTLSKTLEIHVPIRSLWKSRGRSALDLIAHIAQAADQDQVTRALACSILAKDDFILRLWQSGDEYTALVYDLLLALDKRLFLIQHSPTHREWQILD